jgi:hypothetical protein
MTSTTTASTETSIGADRGPFEPLMQRTLDYIRDHPEEHDQDSWAVQTLCGTKRCLAGTAVFLAGYHINYKRMLPVDDEDRLTHEASTCVDPTTGETRSIRRVAQELLGLDNDEVDLLFFGSGSVEYLSRVFSELTDGRVS